MVSASDVPWNFSEHLEIEAVNMVNLICLYLTLSFSGT